MADRCVVVFRFDLMPVLSLMNGAAERKTTAQQRNREFITIRILEDVSPQI